MNISRFFGATNREAMRQVRLALGPDALIISNRRVNGGVEILATDQTSLPEDVVRQIADQEAASAASRPPVTMRSPVRPQQPPAAPGGAPAATPAATASAPSALRAPGVPSAAPSRAKVLAGAAAQAAAHRSPAAPPPPPGGAPLFARGAAAAPQGPDLLGAIGALQGALESRIDELVWGSQLKRAPQAISLFQNLLGFGFSTALLRAMLQQLPESLGPKAAFQWARQELIRSLPVLEHEEDLWTPGAAIALVGPTGVGKTTTIAKLAARCVRRQGAENVVLLTTDTYRIGAHEQLKIYGQIMKVPVHVVQDADELRRILAGVGPRQTILIDNVGISQRDRFVGEQAAMLANAGRPIKRLLVLNASSHGDTLDEVARSYTHDGGQPLQGCIISKIDEAIRLGAALDTAIRYQLPVCYVSDGQKVPQNLAFLSAAELIDRALVKSQQSQALYAPSEADFAALLSASRHTEDDSAIEQKRRQWLPSLIQVAGPGQAGLEIEDIDHACAYIDENALAAETAELWRAYFNGDISDSVGSLTEHLVRVAQNEWVGSQADYMLALHDHVAFREGDGRSGGRVRATSLLSQTGMPWSSPYQQVFLADGWRTSDGKTAIQAPGTADALTRQLEWAAKNLSRLPVLHVFDAASQAVWQRAAALELSWLSPCAPMTRVVHHDTPTTVGALVKTLDFHPAGALGGLLQRLSLGGVPKGRLVVWVASQPVQVVSRQLGTLNVNLVAVRLVDRESGTVLRTLQGLAFVGIPAANTERQAMAMLVHAEHKTALKLAARWWPMLAPRQWADAAQKRAMTAMQVGLTTWDAFQSPAAEDLQRALCGLAGRDQPNQAEAVSAMMKLFTLKEMSR